MDIRKIQTRLKGYGRDPGPLDGILGPKTYAALFDYMARRPLRERGNLLAKGALIHFPTYRIDTELRLAHFLAQASHETADFCHLRELWGPTHAQKRYEGRADLGNLQPGDGFKYRGRGVFQLTGRFNYRSYGPRVGLDLENEPDLAARPDVSVHIACLYWSDRGLNKLADQDNIEKITRAINGGQNGLEARRRCLNHAKAVML